VFQESPRSSERAITLTLPAILSAKFIYCVVPGATKAEAVTRMLRGPISTSCPATILRKHNNAVLFLDEDSAKLVRPCSAREIIRGNRRFAHREEIDVRYATVQYGHSRVRLFYQGENLL